MSAVEACAIEVSGVVQGVGFRPFVHALASRLGLSGFVRNRLGGVLVEIEGSARDIERFITELSRSPPPLARVAEIRTELRPPTGCTGFHIESSDKTGDAAVFVSPDAATCDDCLRELFDPGDRRYRYPFLNCTNCGPRFTIVTGAPYDRERTTMASFAMCESCLGEYGDPRDRRFHAQPIACRECGPRLRALDANGDVQSSEDPLSLALACLAAGGIVALKGIGGQHLACDARSERATSKLRARKSREEKPFAIMVRDLVAAETLCHVSAEERALLSSSARPIVLLQRRERADIAASVAPNTHRLGVMLPYSPLHHLLARGIEGSLVMTSGNRSDEPVAFEDEDAATRLQGIADLFLTHDRPIHTRCDDSVTQVVLGAPLVMRRSRGYAPLPVVLTNRLESPTLALGAELKSTFALGMERRAILSHHLGDLQHYEAFRAYADAIADYERLYKITPARLVHDMHPDYASTRYARERAASSGAAIVSVQHHHAHMASCMEEHHLEGEVIAVCFDGAGYGLDGAIWGGEFLVGGRKAFRRAAHLAYAPMPGGERAIREPWRMAVAHLVRAGENPADALFAKRIGMDAIAKVSAISERALFSPRTSSIGRLFDAIASLAGVCDRASFEGQGAMRLESLASAIAADRAYPFELAMDEGVLIVEPAPLVREALRDVRAGVNASIIARRFHSAIAAMIGTVCARLRDENNLDRVVLSGGVFMNALVTEETSRGLARLGLRAYVHRTAPPNDGGLCLGQLAIVAARDAAESH